jgi:hypothetical protein
MLFALAFAALADNHVTTFGINPSYTPPPFSGLERLDVDPAVVAKTVLPSPMRPPGEASQDAPVTGQLVLTNPTSQWADVSVQGQAIGIIGPYATMRLQGLGAGWYGVKLALPTGFSRTFAAQVP